ncbi:MAG: TetR family transcriptional regulator [Phenylobacterium sp.]|uniref:TetR/AcrR family transcriptional regulator n=1 Tax=Phenylobacterium sp. TaxID=1871053 RepID=UPI0025D7442C|nr:TetR/AcrR family transcriptional regulator [Phenylobacterium sp.]MBI1198583.1 TetR family transcriptional regulator [Phenylobacterium sp.]
MADDLSATARRASSPRKARPDARGRGRPVGDREAKRAELLAAALAVIAEEGYAGASLRRVAQRAGCTTGAVTYYFASKEEMMAALIESRFDVFDTILEVQEKIDIRAGFRLWLDLMSDEQSSTRTGDLQLLASARHEPALAAVYQRRYGRYRDGLTSILARRQAEGRVRTDIAADVLSDQLCAMGDGWMMLLPIEPERFSPERVQVLLDATMALIAPAAGATGRAGA